MSDLPIHNLNSVAPISPEFVRVGGQALELSPKFYINPSRAGPSIFRDPGMSAASK